MYYKVTIPKDNETTRNFLLQAFDMLEDGHKSERNETRAISLHCKYDLKEEDRYSFYNEDIDIYFKVDAMTPEVKKWLTDYNFTPTDSFPKDLKHILGNDFPATIKLEKSMRYV